MTPESAEHLGKAHICLTRAQKRLTDGEFEEAGRAAYMAAFNAAQALIQDRTGRTPRTHKGLHGKFTQLAREVEGLDSSLIPFLGRAYPMKIVADYAIGPQAVLPLKEAERAVIDAGAFVAAIERCLSA